MSLATFWEIFSQTLLVTLVMAHPEKKLFGCCCVDFPEAGKINNFFCPSVVVKKNFGSVFFPGKSRSHEACGKRLKRDLKNPFFILRCRENKYPSHFQITFFLNFVGK
jgi:hypothetical protein